jgi:hypothetical protein
MHRNKSLYYSVFNLHFLLAFLYRLKCSQENRLCNFCLNLILGLFNEAFLNCIRYVALNGTVSVSDKWGKM